jgi:hypothetical protein
MMYGGAGSLFGGLQGGSLMSNGGAMASIPLLESLSAQGRLASLQQGGDQQGGIFPPGMPRSGAGPPSHGGAGGFDSTKFYQ